jgi:hypothetical protein
METREKKYLSCAETAKLLRLALKGKFPTTKFSVKSSTYSGGASITVRYTDGPAPVDVEKLCKLYEGAQFDGMQDLKTYQNTILTDENGNMELVHFGADFIFVERDYTEKYCWPLCKAFDLRNGAPSLSAQMHLYYDLVSRRHSGAKVTMTDFETGYSLTANYPLTYEYIELVCSCLRNQGHNVEVSNDNHVLTVMEG